MVFESSFERLWAKLALALIALVGCVLLVRVVVYGFVVGTLTDDRISVSRDVLAAHVDDFPGSARLQARYAKAELMERERDLVRAEFYAMRAINLSPYNHNYQVLLASIKEAQGDRAAAEEALREALGLAPNDTEVHWRLANLLVRQGRLAESLDEFRVATSADGSLLPATLDLLWRASGRKLETVERVVGDEPEKRLMLAQFLLRQSREEEAAKVFDGLDRSVRLFSPESPAFLNSLIAAGNTDLAYNLWANLIGTGPERPLIWNGGFESDILRHFSQFDWTIKPNDYARIALDTSAAHSGHRSLRVDFIGRDTTRLDGEITQLVVARPGARYRLECFVKTDALDTPEGPHIAVTSSAAPNWSAVSDPIAAGTRDWQAMQIDFVAPQSSSIATAALYVTIRRVPKFSYDDPTKGTVWFDDFKISEQ